MARTRADILADLPPARRAHVEAATTERIAQVEGLCAPGLDPVLLTGLGDRRDDEPLA